jgi:hypothetical protein
MEKLTILIKGFQNIVFKKIKSLKINTKQTLQKIVMFNSQKYKFIKKKVYVR